MRQIDMIREVTRAAKDRWPEILSSLDIDVPRAPGMHGPCPACGGKDRFRFDDLDGRGTHFCNQCEAGDGLELVMKVKRVISARTVRGGGGRKAQASKGNDHPQVADLDDDLPF